jgi:spore germination protein YaaH
VEKNKKSKFNLFFKIGVIILLLLLIFCAYKLAPNYTKNDSYAKNKINLIINNNNVTKKLKKDLFINEKDVIYMSKEDIKNYFDKYIIYDEENNQIITTYGEKIGVLPIGQNIIKINDSEVEVISGAIKKDDTYYLPISSMAKVYNVDIQYIKNNNILTLDSLEKKLVKADVTKNCTVRYKTTLLSKKMDKLKKGDKVICIQNLDNAWTKVRTLNGYIGYIKTKNIQNEVYVREDINEEKNDQKINLVWDYYSEYGKAPNRTGTTIEGVNVVSPAFFSLVSKANGKINVNIGEKGQAYLKWAKDNNYKVWPMFSNNSYKETTQTILKSYTLRTQVINNIVDLAVKYGLDGINIDFENMNTEDKDNFSRFIIELKPKLKEAGIKLSVDVTAPDGGSSWSECYNRSVIGDVADYIVFMAYDQYGNGSKKAGTTAGYNWVETNLKKFIDREQIPSNKIILGIPFYTRIWTESNGDVTSKTVNMKNINSVLPADVTKEWNEELKQYYVEYTQNGKTYKMWIEDEESIKNKVSLVKQYNLAGVAAWAKDREQDSIWTVINNELN